MSDPTMSDPAVLIPTSPLRSAPSSPRHRSNPGSPAPAVSETPNRRAVTDLLDVPELAEQPNLSSTDGESHDGGDDDTVPSSTTPAGDERSEEDNPSSITRFIQNTRHRVGSIIDVSEESKVYTIEGSMPDEEGDLYEGEVRPLIYGYLHKLGRNGKWQRRYFETDGESLTYYKSDKRIKVLASLDLCKVGTIAMSPGDPLSCTFLIQVVDRPYSLRADNKATCKDWVITLNRIKEARFQLGGVKLVSPEFHHQTVDLLDKDATGEIAPRVVLSANRQRTRAVDGENVDSWQSLLDHENKLNASIAAEHHSSTERENLARWQKRRSMLYSLRRAAVRWARSIRMSCMNGSPDQDVLDSHCHPPGHDDGRSSCSSSSDMNDDAKLELQPNWPSPPPIKGALNVAARAHEIT